MADGGQQQDWPNRRNEILGSTVPIAFISTGFVIWRVVYGIRGKRKLLVCDYLLIVAALINLVTTGLRFKTTYHGQGRHIQDPSIGKPYDILEYSYHLWIGQILNLIGVAILKYSICAYLLALRFPRVYIVFVWLSILMVTVFNFIYPMISLFNCTPMEANWNKAMKGKCFMKSNMTMTYFNGVTNIVTDIVYIVAPILYLSTIQLHKRTQWGLRIVFCLSLVPLICSIMKTTYLGALSKTRDPTWDAVDLSIWAATELSIGVLVASLPPLRKQFDKFFQKITSSTGTRSKQPSSMPMYNMSKPQTIGSRSRKGTQVAMDDDSERSILPDTGITKTIVHEFSTEERKSAVAVPPAAYGMHKDKSDNV